MGHAKELQQKLKDRLQELKPKQVAILDMMEALQGFVDHTEEVGSILKPEALPSGKDWDAYRKLYDQAVAYLWRIPEASDPRSAEWLISELDERKSFYPVGEEPYQLFSCYHYLKHLTRPGYIPCADDVEGLTERIQESVGILSGETIEELHIVLALVEAQETLDNANSN